MTVLFLPDLASQCEHTGREQSSVHSFHRDFDSSHMVNHNTYGTLYSCRKRVNL
jgi:hypothetical protein